MPNLGLDLKSMVEWCMVGFDSKNRHQNTCVEKEIEPRAQKLLTILDTIANIIVRNYTIIY